MGIMCIVGNLIFFNPLQRLTQMPPKTIDEAEHILQKSTVSKTLFNLFSKDTLQLLCDKYTLEVSPTGKRQTDIPIKLDYIGALLSEVEVSQSQVNLHHR